MQLERYSLPMTVLIDSIGLQIIWSERNGQRLKVWKSDLEKTSSNPIFYQLPTASILAKRKEMLLVQIDDGKRRYCNAMEMCVLMSTSGIPMSSGFRNFYSEVKPSAMSRQYQDYTKISSLYFAQEFCLFVPGYGPIFPAVSCCKNDFRPSSDLFVHLDRQL